MTTEGFKRKLTAFFSADVLVYSHLMREEEDAMFETLEASKRVSISLIKKERRTVLINLQKKFIPSAIGRML